MDRHPQILVYAYGNPGRQDDGLGGALVKELEVWTKEEGLKGIDFDSNYQLNIEDAETISKYDIVIFADASTEEITDFILTPVSGKTEVTFTTHAASPGYIVQLCMELFNRKPDVYLLHIKGFEWEFYEGLSPRAEMNLVKSMDFMKRFILKTLHN